MKCRFDIIGRKIWIDNDNLYDTRPQAVDIVLYRDGVEYKTATVSSLGDGMYRFPCLLIWKNANEKYVYTVDEVAVPDGYTKTIQGYNVVNMLNEVQIDGVKIWDDNNNAENARPMAIPLSLHQNGVEIEMKYFDTSDFTVNTVDYTFGARPFADAQNVPYVYTVTEGNINMYGTVIDGFTITNTYQGP